MKMSQLDVNTLTKQYNAGKPLCLRGAPGISKTAKVLQFCESQGLGCVIENITSVDAPDARGFLIPTKTDTGPVAMYSKPSWLARIEETGLDQGVVLLDEFLAGDHIVQKAYAPLLSERQAGDWKVPDGWVMWLTGNRTIDRSGANKMLAHVGDRMCLLDVQADLDGWVQWATDEGIHPMYIAFATARPGVVFNDEPAKDPNQVGISPRSLTYAHDFHTGGEVRGDLSLDSDDVTTAMVAGYIGDAATAELFAFIKTAGELPTIGEIIADPQGAKLPSNIRMDAQYAAIQLCVHHAESENIDQIFQYVCRLNKELQASTARQMIDKTKGSLLNSASMGKWMSENAALITSTWI